MKKYCLLLMILTGVVITPVHAEDSWTEVALYGFASDISGKTVTGGVTSEVDVSFSDVIENLDLGFMGLVEHRNGKWSLIGDVFYADISVGDTVAANDIATVNLGVEVEQLLVEGFVGYRVFQQDQEDARLGADILGGVRYNRIDVGLDVQASLLGLTTSASRNSSEDWLDGVVGVRAQYAHSNGWGVSGWADIGEGADSSSYQLVGLVNYTFDNNVKVFGGYRQYSMEYEFGSGASHFELDLEYSGPMLGVVFRL